MTITTIRHGQTAWNLEGRWQGHTDISLDETGILQGKKVAARLANTPCDIIYTSDLSRAADTAGFIAAHHAADVMMTRNLREMAFGIFEGRTVSNEVFVEMAEYDKAGKPYPGAESPRALFARISNFLDDVLLRGHENIFLVSHGGTILAIIGYFLRLSVEDLMEMPVGNTAIHVFKKLPAGWTMTTENDTRHLT